MPVVSKLDGIVVVLRDFEHCTLEIPLRIKITQVEPLLQTDFRGTSFQAENGQRIVKCVLGKQSEYTVTIVSVEKKCSNALEGAIMTDELWLDEGTEVFPNQFYTRGNLLLQCIRENPNNKDGKVNVVYSSFGQSCRWSRLDRKLKNFQTSLHQVETFVHYARDFEKKDCACFFDSKLVHDKFSKRQIKQTYTAALQKGCANFYIDENRLLPNVFAKILEVKLYSEAFKTAHNSRLFPKSTLANKLLDPIEIARGFQRVPTDLNGRLNEFHKILSDLHKVREEVLSYGVIKKQLYARCEMIIKIWLDATENPAAKISEAFESDPRFSSEKVWEMITSQISTAKLHQNLRKTYMPFWETLNMYVTRKIEALENDTDWIFDAGTFELINTIFYFCPYTIHYTLNVSLVPSIWSPCSVRNCELITF